MSEPLACFITFRTYGTWLHGDSRGSVDSEHNTFGEPFAEPNEVQEASARQRMKDPPVVLSAAQRRVVDAAVREVATYRQWLIHTLKARTNHVHVVITAAGVTPEKAMNDFKAYATRRLREAGLARPDQRVWSRHGSTPHPFDDAATIEAIHYVANLQ